MKIEPWQRLLGVFLGTALPIALAGNLMGMQTWEAALLGGAAAILRVLIRLANYSQDGKLTKREIDESFKDK